MKNVILIILLAAVCIAVGVGATILVCKHNNKGYMTNNNICTQDEYEKTLFGQSVSEERNGEIRMVIKCTEGFKAELTIYEAKNGKYESIFNCPAVIGKNEPAKHAEGDTKTPLGTLRLFNRFGIQ